MYARSMIYDPNTREIVSGTCSCAMCKRTSLNAGIEKVVIRDDRDNVRTVLVSDWIENDDSLSGQMGY